MANTRKKFRRAFRPVNPDAAGIDIGSRFHVVAVPSDRDETPVRSFDSFTADLHRLADWLLQCRIDTVAMESTGIYWMPLYAILEERGIRVVLSNARDIKHVPGRKSDVSDAQWLQQLHQHGLVRGSFHPGDGFDELRAYLRQRERLVQYAASHVQHMQKALMLMNVQLHHVVTDLSGKTGLAIVRAIVAGEREPLALAALRDRRCKCSVEKIAAALEGDYRDEHLLALKQSLSLYDTYNALVAECDLSIEATLLRLRRAGGAREQTTPKKRKGGRQSNEPAFDVRSAVAAVTGVDLTEIDGIGPSLALRIVGECGTDMSKWPTVKHFTSWLCLAPGTKISGGKVLSSRTRRTNNRVTTLLRLGAVTVGRTDSALGAFFRRLSARVGKAKAVTATARKLAVFVYNLLKYGKAYKDPGAAYYEERYRDRAIRNLTRRAEALGLRVEPAVVVS